MTSKKATKSHQKECVESVRPASTSYLKVIYFSWSCAKFTVLILETFTPGILTFSILQETEAEVKLKLASNKGYKTFLKLQAQLNMKSVPLLNTKIPTI